MSQADLEISLSRRNAVSAGGSDGAYMNYDVKFRFSLPDSETEQHEAGVNSVGFDEVELRQRGLDPAAYGQYLAAQLLAEPAVRSLFDQACAVAQAAADVPLRLRLASARNAPNCTTCAGRRCATRPIGDPCSPARAALLALPQQPDWRPVKPAPARRPARPGGDRQPGRPRQVRMAAVDVAASSPRARAGLGSPRPSWHPGQRHPRRQPNRLRDGSTSSTWSPRHAEQRRALAAPGRGRQNRRVGRREPSW